MALEIEMPSKHILQGQKALLKKSEFSKLLARHKKEKISTLDIKIVQVPQLAPGPDFGHS